MKLRTPLAPSRERRYPVLTAIDLTLYWLLNIIAVGLSALALKMLIVLALQHPAVQMVLHRLLQ